MGEATTGVWPIVLGVSRQAQSPNPPSFFVASRLNTPAWRLEERPSALARGRSISLLPGMPCAMRARSGRGRHAHGRQERRAPPSCTPPCARPASTARHVRTTGHGARVRCSRPCVSAISADPIDRRAPPARSDQLKIPVTFVANNFSLLLCPRVVQDHARTSEGL